MNQSVESILKECLEKLTIEVESIEFNEQDPYAMYVVHTKDAKKLIGIKGENLRALNSIVKRIVEHTLGTEHLGFTIDVNGYQRERIDEIKRKVQILAERVRAFKASTELSPMNAYERMIVHSLIADDPELETESIGDGRMKKIIIKYHEKEPTEETFT